MTVDSEFIVHCKNDSLNKIVKITITTNTYVLLIFLHGWVRAVATRRAPTDARCDPFPTLGFYETFALALATSCGIVE
jgi:hypothetical protein